MKLIERLLERLSGGTNALPELKMQSKICYPGYKDCEYDSLRDAVLHFRKNGFNMEYRLPDIIMYNVCYRDYLRNYGMDMLLKRLVKDVPELAKDEKLLQSLQKWYDKEGKNLSGYDIQCYNIMDTITVLGHEFYGLEDVMAHSSAYGRIGCSDMTLNECNPQKKVPNLYIAELYARYPIFDSYDIGDDRTYQNYVFTNEPIDDEKLKEIAEIRHNYDYCMVHENIPEHLLPILYYRGDGDYMILAQKK